MDVIPAAVSSPRLPRIVILTTYFHPVIGGVETHARQLARRLVDSGLDTWVLTKQMDGGTPPDDVVDGIRVRRLPPRGPRRAGAKWALVPRAVAALLQFRDEYDLILCIDYRGIGLAALIAGRLAGKPVVFDAETPGAMSCGNWDPSFRRIGLSPDGLLARVLKFPARTLYGLADGYACISREIQQEVLARGVEASAACYLPHTVDTLRFQPAGPAERDAARRVLGLPLDRTIVVFVGRLAREKGILDLLGAWRLLDRDDATLLVVGPDMPGNALDVGPQVRDLAATFPAGRVVLHGPAADVRPLLQAADVFVQPSHYEAFGLSVIEALATGLPVVATRVGGMAEYLRHNENALLVSPGDVAELSRHLARLLDDRDLARRLAVRARRTAEAEFDERVVIGHWIEMLRGLLPTSAAASGAMAGLFTAAPLAAGMLQLLASF